jgi:hypothetical protein
MPIGNWYLDTADFTETITDERAGRRLARSRARAPSGADTFRRFKVELHEEYPDLLPARYAFRDVRDVRAKRRAVEWLVDNSLGPPLPE